MFLRRKVKLGSLEEPCLLFYLTRKITGIVLGSGERKLHRDCGLILAGKSFFRKVKDAIKVRGWVSSTKIGLQSLLA